MEHKTSAGYATKATDEGVVETVFAVMGNIDKGKDRIWPGAFAKTFQERGGKIKVLDHHKTDSIMRVVGKPLMLRELGRDELPADLLEQHPDATGGAWAKVQFLMDTPEGQGAFTRIKQGVIDEWSFGYDALDKDYSQEKNADGERVTVRNLRTVRLHELSPVLWGMNPATETLSAKAEVKNPWSVFERDGKWHVYKVNEDGEPVGESLGEYDSEEEAVEQVRALYAAEKRGDTPSEVEEEEEKAAPKKKEGDGEHPASHYLVVEDPDKPTTWHLRVRNVEGELDHGLMGAAHAALTVGYRGNRYQGPNAKKALARLKKLYEEEGMDLPSEKNLVVEAKAALSNVLQGWLHRAFTNLCDDWYIQGHVNREERIELSNAIGESLDALADAVPEHLASREVHAPYIEHRMGHELEFPALDEVLEEVKAGRVLSQRNADRIESALNTLIDVLRDAGMYDDEGPERSTPMEYEAGPMEQSPTSDMLKEVEAELEQLGLLTGGVK